MSDVRPTEQTACVRFGLATRAGDLRGWHRLVVEHLMDAGKASIELRIVVPAAAPASGSLAHSLLRCYGAWAGHTKLWRRHGGHDLLGNIPRLSCDLGSGSGTASLDPNDRNTVSELKLDIILQLEGAPLSSDVGSLARYGVWRFVHGSGDPDEWPFLGAVTSGASTATSILCGKLPSSDHWTALRQGVFRTNRWSYRRTRDSSLAEAARWPALAARDLAMNGPRVTEPVNFSATRLPPGVGAVPRLGVRIARNVAVDLMRGIGSYEIWNVGWSRMTPEQLIGRQTLSEVHWLPKHRAGHYVADPFFIRTQPRLAWLVEEFSYFGRGCIAELEYESGKGPLEVRRLLQLPYHASYPFILKTDGRVYCIPETSQGDTLVLHENVDGTLVPVHELIHGRRVVDATLVFEDGFWWLFCGLHDDNDTLNLHIFFAETLRGTWKPHPLNPVKSDVRSARPAGPMFRVGGELYRPSQNCSESYGGSVTLNRVRILSPTAFAEEYVLTVPPIANSRYPLGLHTIAFADGFVVIDGKTRVWGLYPLAALLNKIRRRRATHANTRTRQGDAALRCGS